LHPRSNIPSKTGRNARVDDGRNPFHNGHAAQALENELPLVTRAPDLAAFGCKVLW
jgi:hypothetical protein